MALGRTRTEMNRTNTYNENLQQLFHVTIGNTGSVRILAIESPVI